MYVDVNGHTDAIGSYGYYQALSERRAGAVADCLADRSVMFGRLHFEGFGKIRANCLQRNNLGARCKPPGRDRADALYHLSVGCDRISVFSVQKYIDGDTPRTVRKSLTRERQTARRTS